jgi:hypothetical protein
MNKCPVQHSPQDLHKVLAGNSPFASGLLMAGIISEDGRLYNGDQTALREKPNKT